MKGRAILGKKWSPGRLRRYRERMAQLRAQGHFKRSRDPRTEVVTLTCARPECAKEFEFVFWPSLSRTKKRFCSHACQVSYFHAVRTRVPSVEVLRELYKTMTAAEIGKIYNLTGAAIRYALIRAGIPRRKPGGRTKAEKCKAATGQ